MSSKSSFWITEQIQWIQPGGRPDLDDNPRLVFLPFTATAFLRSRAAVLSLHMATECLRANGDGKEGGECGGEAEEEGDEWCA